jgi:hypothetical protein
MPKKNKEYKNIDGNMIEFAVLKQISLLSKKKRQTRSR